MNENISQNSLSCSQLELKLKCNSVGKTIICHQYATHPLRISRPFFLERNNSHRIYLYLRNNSPGLLAEDKLNFSLELEEQTSLYLTEQAATKVHPILNKNIAATVNYQLILQENSTLEFVPEPLIFYVDAALKQNIDIKLHPTANLFWSEIILPGRLARGEFYQFNYYDNRLWVSSLEGELYFQDRIYLEGKNNIFDNSKLFASFPVIASAIAIFPQISSSHLQQTIETTQIPKSPHLSMATSILPNNKGVLIKILAQRSEQIKQSFQSIINAIRCLHNQNCLPYIPK